MYGRKFCHYLGRVRAVECKIMVIRRSFGQEGEFVIKRCDRERSILINEKRFRRRENLVEKNYG